MIDKLYIFLQAVKKSLEPSQEWGPYEAKDRQKWLRQTRSTDPEEICTLKNQNGGLANGELENGTCYHDVTCTKHGKCNQNGGSNSQNGYSNGTTNGIYRKKSDYSVNGNMYGMNGSVSASGLAGHGGENSCMLAIIEENENTEL